ncbi:glycoside hydrolase family 31 protein [Neobacillus kokaensis]|uniref:Glycoside hydrolase n=1 Tax=Neobacillus kokaensis TaxID=2759023 RepID=A0ABQ3N5M6_9BACI|nr:glycoside hydrolase family 31 protein [Neobacillus kokaensis]GHI00023.1 glycoside hydrolase [Neobacillus kokaensis]
MEKQYQIELLDGEYWWGGAVADGIHMPFGNQPFERTLTPNLTPNQAAPILISNKGRFIWSEEPFDFAFTENLLEISNAKGDVQQGEGYLHLRDVYKAVQAKFFPPTSKLPEPLMFTSPQYNTWIELMYDQEEEKILEYAEAIIANGMPPGILMIDDNWQEDYGVWNFHPGRFKNPEKMVERLHQLGFKVMLWTCPFVSPDSSVFRKLMADGLLLKDENGMVAIRQWWNGYSAILDLTNEKAVEWYQQQLDHLVDYYKIDGFKFDAGDPMYYKDTDQSALPTHANGHAEKFAELGRRYRLNEYRACWKMAGEPIGQRLCDKLHSWGDNGLGSLIPNGLAQGLMGYAFTCPDMIGGGEFQNFLANSDQLDQELFVRYAQCSALFPMMQFSAAPWRVLDDEHFGYCLEAAKLHERFGNDILQIAESAALTGEPIIRHMAYMFPEEGFEKVNDQFMLGDDILVAPVVTKGTTQRFVHFPTGAWQDEDGNIIQGPAEQLIDAPLSRLTWYKRVK